MASTVTDFDDQVAQFMADEHARHDPAAFWRALRETGPAYHSRALDAWFLSGYDECHQFLQNATARVSYSPLSRAACEVGQVIGSFRQELYETLLFMMDPPMHTATRAIARRTFSGPTAEHWRDEIRGHVQRCLAGTTPGEEFDFVAEVSRQLPAMLMCQLLGLSFDDAPRLQTYVPGYMGIIGDPTPEQEAEGLRVVEEFSDYLSEVIAQRPARVGPGDLLDELVEAERAGKLTRRSIASFVMMIILGGYDTLAGQLSNGVWAFTQHPEQWQLLVEDPDRAALAVEESIRYESSIQLLPSKTVLEDLDINGTVLPAGATVWLSLAAANRDPRQFRDPEAFEILRSDNRHMGFGFGPHFCMGAAFARVEMEECFRELARSGSRLLPGASPIAWERGLITWAPTKLPVVLEPGRA
jgi:cytochrome P450